MEKHCKVIFLEDINGIIKIKNKNGNLFILSDEEIKEGDWIQRSNEAPVLYTENFWFDFGIKYSKIIATTDTSLELPQPSQQFIEKFIEEYNKGNIIKEVEVEYEVDYSIECDETPSDYQRYSDKKVGCSNCIKAIFKLKINSDNTINIKSAKDSWTLEELHDLLAKHEYDKGVIDWKNFIPELCNEIGYPIVEEWIETNL